MQPYVKSSRYGWSSWSILVIAFITVFFHRLSIGSVADELTREIPMNSVTLGNLTAMNYYAYALMQIPVGILVDRIGVRKINFCGLLVTAAGSILFGLAHTLEAAYLSRFLVGIGSSVIIVSIFKIQATWFPLSRFSALSGLTSFFGNFGSLLALYPLTFLSLTFGWRNVFYWMAGISLLLALLVLWGVRDARTGIYSPSRETAATGPISRLRRKNFQTSDHTTTEVKPAPFLTYLKESLSSVLKNPKTWPNVLTLFAFTGSSTTLLGLWGIPLITQIYSLDKATAAGYVTFATFGFILGAPLVSLWVRLLKGIRPALLAGTGLNLLLWIYITIIAGGHPAVQLWPAFFFIFGLLIMTHILAFSNVTAVNPLNYSGIATAITNMAEFIGSAIASLTIGLILDFSGNPTAAWWVILSMAALGFIAALLMKEQPIQM
ncbi:MULTISPECIES: MFS transporter [Desulfitobacterium]|uniref:Sugar phosphate permease n=1 Tax=Desulfitobacterium dehalogenans (strain ATCC 51507 / DSM 9161 / JW/IU-DC1) TaxID=756499 RepID=I4A4H0_DESDJ|nr:MULTISPECIES: MFS transporter [Desulfitobacterium]AFL98854.1 sugar phosphate permease [Desulfitobacterium dehalogenans ATCC 51507]